MSRVDQQKTSRSLAIYELLLNLYPRDYRRHHGAEMLQNFEDFEQISSSKTGLWLFFGKDLATSITTHCAKSWWGQTAIVFAVLIGVLVAVWQRHGHHGRAFWGFGAGYVLGWFIGWRRKERQTRLDSSSASKSFFEDIGVVCLVLMAVLVAVHIFTRSYERAILALCYGCVIAVPAGWLGKRWESRP